MPPVRLARKPKQKPKSPEETYDLMMSDPDEFLRRAAISSPIVFAEANLRNEKGEPLEYTEQHGFQVQYIKDFSRRICVIKSSQVGITTSSITKILYLSHITDKEDWHRLFGRNNKRGLNTIYTFPTANDVNDFSATRFRPMVLSSDMLTMMMGGKRGVDAVQRKKIGNSFILFRGAQKESQAISQPADLIVNDELDFSSPNIIDLFDSRITKSDLKWWWKFSTPTIPNYGIDAEYRLSNQMRWMVRCGRCRKDQEIKYPENIRVKDVGGISRAYWGCRRCDKELQRTVGRWVPTYFNRDYNGYYIPPTICEWIQPLDIEESRKRYKTEKQFQNFALGRAYATGEDVVTRELLLNRVEFGRGFNPVLDRMMFMGVDQGDVLHFTISRGQGARREIVEVGTRNSFHEIGALMNDWNIDLCVMDAMPNKKSAQEFANTFDGRVLLSIYKEFDEEEDVKAMKSMRNGVLVDRTNSLDSSAASWREGKSVIVLDSFKYNVIPPHFDDPSSKEPFIQQMGNEVRDEVENKKTGKMRAVWVATGPDHYRHADNYNYIAWTQRFGEHFYGEAMVSANKVMVESVGSLPEFNGRRSGLRTPL